MFDAKLSLSVTNNFFVNVLILKHYRERDACMRRLNRSYTSLGVGGGGGGFLEDKTSVPDIFSSCLFIPRAHFERGLMMVSCYGYEI